VVALLDTFRKVDGKWEVMRVIVHSREFSFNPAADKATTNGARGKQAESAPQKTSPAAKATMWIYWTADGLRYMQSLSIAAPSLEDCHVVPEIITMVKFPGFSIPIAWDPAGTASSMAPLAQPSGGARFEEIETGCWKGSPAASSRDMAMEHCCSDVPQHVLRGPEAWIGYG
jgi:hypothetical protein